MKEKVPVLLLKNLVLLPYQEIRLELSNETSKKSVDLSKKEYNSKLVVLTAPNNLEITVYDEDLPNIGVLASIKTCITLPNGNYRVTLLGINRVKINEYFKYLDKDDILIALIKRIYIKNIKEEDKELVHIKTLKKLIEEYININPKVSNSIKNSILKSNDLDKLVDIITNFLPIDDKRKVNYMNEFDYLVRANDLIHDLNLEIESIKLENEIEENIQKSLEKDHKEYVIKEKIKRLEQELSTTSIKKSIINDLKDRIELLSASEPIKSRLEEELRKLSYTPETNPDYSVIRNYIETVLSLPWNKYSTEITDLKMIKNCLDRSHYGLEDVKKRILEFVAIKELNKDINAPIICLVGPPGTGKTTLGMSIASALNREFYKISVGGLNDSTELTGHKRTYLGSSPGKIIQGLKRCNSANPLFLIDEVDKIVKDFKGDPASILLDILDKNQNNAFIDNYIEEPFDLSKVLFILTANDYKNIPDALRDRLEIIDVSSYTQLEKLDIAKKYIIPNSIKEYNSPALVFNDKILLEIIVNYTSEAGVRELDRIIKRIIRYVILNEIKRKSITISLIREILGPVKYGLEKRDSNYVGAANALAVYRNGGAIINIETILIEGTGRIITSGNLGDSVKESINLALSYIRGYASIFKIDLNTIDKKDICLNMFNYGIKKTGSSGGVATTAALLSLLSNKIIDSNVAFSGEMSLHGDILKVGGIKEKIIGAYNHGIKVVYIPLSNKNDLDSIPDYVKSSLDIRCVDNFKTIYNDLIK